MSLIYKNIIGSTAVALIDSYINENDSQEITSISLCNTHVTDSVDVDLYYHLSEPDEPRFSDDTGNTSEEFNSWDPVDDIIYKYHILKSVTIPKGVSVILSDEYHFKLVSGEYQLYIKLNASDSTVDVIINKK
tara:strand:+ start:1884 stop:2282 length:399 start_codon:yes stop_codon:yes gene_type:complete